MAAPNVHSLRKLQADLNAAIDSYVACIEAQPTLSSSRKAAAERVITDSANAITDAFRNPFVKVREIGLQPTQNVVIRIALDLDLFNRIDGQVTLDELVAKTGAEAVLLLRICRVLVAARILLEPEARTYCPTPSSRLLQNPIVDDWFKMFFDILAPIWIETPKWFAKNGHQDIASFSNNPTLSMYGSNFFEFLAEDPEREASFAAAMKIQEFAPATARPRFSFDDGIRDFTTSASAGGSDVFFVDVGGGQGQYLNTLIQWHPEMPGRKVLQDLPTVVAGVPKDTSTFEPMGHDFFKPQSVQGAKYYHLRGILHDWPDNECLQILSQLRAAFEPDYSRLLVQSMILPETDYALFDTMLDINMWTCCGIERTLNQWDALLQKAGFQVVNVVRAEVGSFGIIEAKAAHDARSS